MLPYNYNHVIAGDGVLNFKIINRKLIYIISDIGFIIIELHAIIVSSKFNTLVYCQLYLGKTPYTSDHPNIEL